MTMAHSAPLQRALYDRLRGATQLAGLAERIFDDVPHRNRESDAGPYVTLGDEIVSPWSTATDRGAAHELVVRVYAPQRGFLTVKQIAAEIVDLIDIEPPTPSGARIVTHEFLGAETRREEQGALRRVDLRFRFTIEADD